MFSVGFSVIPAAGINPSNFATFCICHLNQTHIRHFHFTVVVNSQRDKVVFLIRYFQRVVEVFVFEIRNDEGGTFLFNHTGKVLESLADICPFVFRLEIITCSLLIPKNDFSNGNDKSLCVQPDISPGC